MAFPQLFSQSILLLFAISIAILVITILLVLALITAGSFIWRKISSLKKQAVTEEESAHKKVDKLILDAQNEASKVLRTASEKARTILETATLIKEDVLRTTTREIIAISEQHQQYLKDASLKYVETYEHMAEGAQEEYLNTLHEASVGMARDAKATLGMFETYLKEQTVGYKQAMEKKIEELRKEANAYVDEYKKEKLKRVDKAVDEIILIVAKNIIGRSLNLKEHNELIIRALDEAKKEGFFSHVNL
jgi:uncharacterized protein (UPF0333 family)